MSSPIASRQSRAPALNTGSGQDGLAGVLMRIFDAFERAGLCYCMLHGFDKLSTVGASDVDCVVSRELSARDIHALLDRWRDEIGADVVRCRGHLIQLAWTEPDGAPSVLTLDLSLDAQVHDLTLYTGPEVLGSRRKVGRVWAPSVAVQFGNYVARSIAKRRLDEARTRTLTDLFAQDPAGCSAQVGRFWSGESAGIILGAAESGDWSAVERSAVQLGAELALQARRRFPVRHAATKLLKFVDRAARLLRPDGLSVVVLGPDGAGKSSTTDAVGGPDLLPVFDRSVCWGFVPPLHRLIGRNLGPSSEPHTLPPRSLANSTLRATYWFLYSTMGYARVHLALARNSLVLYDRHFVDILVDPKRYRYAGPMWPMRLIWRLIPKPDLVILLDAPAELIQARKQEVPIAETDRQRAAYLQLVTGLGNGRVVSSAKPFEEVTREINALLVDHLRHRMARRIGRSRSLSGDQARLATPERPDRTTSTLTKTMPAAAMSAKAPHVSA